MKFSVVWGDKWGLWERLVKFGVRVSSILSIIIPKEQISLETKKSPPFLGTAYEKHFENHPVVLFLTSIVQFSWIR